MPEWVFETTELFERRFRQYKKKHPQETAATLNNLETYRQALSAGVERSRIQAGFIHREPQGVVAIDQQGAKGGTHETRLYTYAVEIDCVLHLITMGDKNSQKRDLKDCRSIVSSLRRK